LTALDETGPFDLLITDIQLGPGIDGWRLASLVAERHPDLPVVTMSGFTPAGSKEPEIGRRLSIRKPFRPREILEVLAIELAR
jgi:CheY-like chemotaxis protein